ncbi:hypothetical protein PIB30_061738 [Stylosanthes scabra]|uniref:Uncharacterized protein n=1 Tax=Stylosanthes scabra TaxID=79078 RepID=A0ABU6QLI0_9FABA|nr:hypothetical protein [Stylosanthes scabra]
MAHTFMKMHRLLMKQFNKLKVVIGPPRSYPRMTRLHKYSKKNIQDVFVAWVPRLSKKRQTMENVVRYLIQQQGGSLPPNIAVEMNSFGREPSSADNQDLQGPP